MIISIIYALITGFSVAVIKNIYNLDHDSIMVGGAAVAGMWAVQFIEDNYL